MARGSRRFELVLQCVDMLLCIDNLAVTNLCYTAVIALAFSLLCFDFQLLYRVFVLLNLPQNISFALPLCPLLGNLRFEIFNLVVEQCDALLVVLSANGLTLNFELAHPALQCIYLLGYGVHLQA